MQSNTLPGQLAAHWLNMLKSLEKGD